MRRTDSIRSQIVTLGAQHLERRILVVRGHKVMLDGDLAHLYRVATKQMNKQVRRNPKRFPPDFMFQLSREEYRSLRFQIGTLKRGRHSKYLPRVFTEQGVAMLSSVLHSERAIEVNVEIMRAFARLRALLATHKDLARKLEDLERKYDGQFRVVFNAIRQLVSPPHRSRKPIGFRPDPR